MGMPWKVHHNRAVFSFFEQRLEWQFVVTVRPACDPLQVSVVLNAGLLATCPTFVFLDLLPFEPVGERSPYYVSMPKVRAVWPVLWTLLVSSDLRARGPQR